MKVVYSPKCSLIEEHKQQKYTMPERSPLRVKVEGDLACATRPEMKVERVSYDLITPSAARGILESIFWKPAFKWRIQRIRVLRPIRRISVMRSEVTKQASVRSAKGWAKEGEGHYFADDDHTQRHTLALRDVAYVIEANVHRVGYGKDEHPAKYRDQFRRRVERGQCYHRPYLGCREFAARFAPPDGSEAPPDELAGQTRPLGRMLFDIDYDADEEGRGKPVFFNARLEDGVLDLTGEQHLYDQIQ